MTTRLDNRGLQKWAAKRGFYDFDRFLNRVECMCFEIAPYAITAKKIDVEVSGDDMYCKYRKPWHEYTIKLRLVKNGSMISRNIVPDGVVVKVLNYDGGNE